MQFSEDYTNNNRYASEEMSLPDNDFYSDDVIRDKESYGTKKYVFKIYPENIDFIDEFPLQKRNAVINYAITRYIHSLYEDEKSEQAKKRMKKFLVWILAVLIGAPLFIFLVNISLIATKSNYSQMQNNIHELHRSKGRY